MGWKIQVNIKDSQFRVAEETLKICFKVL